MYFKSTYLKASITDNKSILAEVKDYVFLGKLQIDSLKGTDIFLLENSSCSPQPGSQGISQYIFWLTNNF